MERWRSETYFEDVFEGVERDGDGDDAFTDFDSIFFFAFSKRRERISELFVTTAR